jgi:hypothetical protein
VFTGAIPVEFLSQIVDAVPFDEWRTVYVCCSGSFRPEAALRKRYPALEIIGNDVSLLSVVIGELAQGRPVEFRFKDRLELLEGMLVGAEPIDRAAAVLVAHEAATYRGVNAHARAMFWHYLQNFPKFLAAARKTITHLIQELGSNGFFAGDFQTHAEHAIAAGAGILAFPPTYAAGYERIYEFLHDNVEWSAPAYQIWQPEGLRDWIATLDRAQAHYCVIGDQRFDDLAPAIRYDSASGRKTIYAYTDRSAASLRGKPAKATPFDYRAVDPNTLRADASVSIVQADSGHLTFLKNRYLAKGIKHTTGQLNFLVMLDGLLAGAFIYSRSTVNPEHELYLLSDFAVSTERRLSKLIAALATSRLVVDVARKRFFCDIESIKTTAFTDRPVSMKYRGVFTLESRKPGQLQYRSKIRDQEPDDIYREWFGRYGAAGDADPHGGDEPAAAPAGQPALHDGAAVRAADEKHSRRRRADEPAAGLRPGRRRQRRAVDPVGQPPG